MKNLPVYLIGMALCLYLMIMYTEPAFFVIFFIMAVILILDLAMGIYLKKMVHLSLELPEQLMSKNKRIPVTVFIDNKGWLPVGKLALEIIYGIRNGGNEAAQWVSLYCDSRANARIQFYLESDYCGIVTVSACRYKICSFLRLFAFHIKMDEHVDIPVFPTIFPIHVEVSRKVLDFIGESDRYSTEQSGDDPSEVFDIRDFRPGDRLQRIHWKLTARSEDFMVKEFSKPIGYPVVIFFNFSKVYEDGKKMIAGISEVLEAGLSLSSALISCGCWHYLAWCGSDMSIKRHAAESENDLQDVMGELLYAAMPHMPIADTMKFYSEFAGHDSFCTFISVNTSKIIEINGEAYGERGINRTVLSGKNFIL